mgnify:FL=1|tara:strand:- start:3302 stop:4333 length:1032 start_codon:yes stop_codon:yes gene_type:complete
MSKGKTVSQQTVDPAQMAMYQDLYDKSKSIASQPFVPYTGSRVAGFNPDQLQGFDATRGIFESSQAFDPRGAINTLAGQSAPTLLGADINAYQNPFNTQVIDQSLSDLDRARQMALGGDQDRAISAGAFGGSRSGILEAETNRAFADQAARTSSGLRQAGFNQAQRAAESDIGREMDNRRFQAGLQSGLLGDQYQTLGLLGNMGSQQQNLQQTGLNAGYNEFLRGLDYGPRQLGLLSQGASAMPQNITLSEQYKPGGLEQVGNAASTIASIFALSDERLKDDIELIGNEKGYNIYTWTWNKIAKKLGVNSPTKGVIAQEVMRTNPDAVALHDSGYYMVNYGAL